jgi:hypothetical protein
MEFATKRGRCERTGLPQPLFDHIMSFLRLTESAPMALVSRNWKQWVHQQQINLSSLWLNITDNDVSQLPEKRLRPLHNALLIGWTHYTATIERLATGLRDLVVYGWSAPSTETALLSPEDQEMLVSGCIRFSRSPQLRRFVFLQSNPEALRTWTTEEVFPILAAITTSTLRTLQLQTARNWTTSDDEKSRVMSRLVAIPWSTSLTELQCHASFVLNCCVAPVQFKLLTYAVLHMRTPTELRSLLEGLISKDIAMPCLTKLHLLGFGAYDQHFQLCCRKTAPMADWYKLVATMLHERAELEEFAILWDGGDRAHTVGFSKTAFIVDLTFEEDWIWFHLPQFSFAPKVIINSRCAILPKPPSQLSLPPSIRIQVLVIAPSLLSSFVNIWPEACSAIRRLSLGYPHFPNKSIVADSVMTVVRQKLPHVRELSICSSLSNPVEPSSLRHVAPQLKFLQFTSLAYKGPLSFQRDKNGTWTTVARTETYFSPQTIQFWLDELRGSSSSSTLV